MKGCVWVKFWFTQCKPNRKSQYILVQKIPMNFNNLILYHKISSVYSANQEFANCKHCKSTVGFESLGDFLLPPLIKTMQAELSWQLTGNVWTAKELSNSKVTHEGVLRRAETDLGKCRPVRSHIMKVRLDGLPPHAFPNTGMLLPANSIGTAYL